MRRSGAPGVAYGWGWCRDGVRNENGKEDLLEEELHLEKTRLSKPFEQADYRKVDFSTKAMQIKSSESSKQSALYIPKISGSRCRKEAHKSKPNAGVFTSRIQKFGKNPPLRAENPSGMRLQIRAKSESDYY